LTPFGGWGGVSRRAVTRRPHTQLQLPRASRATRAAAAATAAAAAAAATSAAAAAAESGLGAAGRPGLQLLLRGAQVADDRDVAQHAAAEGAVGRALDEHGADAVRAGACAEGARAHA